jgi:hypothetical protein
MNEAGVSRLEDIEEIKQLKGRYCRMVDGKDWRAFEHLFTEDAEIEIAGAPGGADDLQRFRGRRGFVEQLRKLMDPVVSVHHVHAPEIEIVAPDEARGIWAVADRLTFPPGGPLRILQGYGHYHETYRRRDGRWVIHSMRLSRLSMEPTPGEA